MLAFQTFLQLSIFSKVIYVQRAGIGMGASLFLVNVLVLCSGYSGTLYSGRHVDWLKVRVMLIKERVGFCMQFVVTAAQIMKVVHSAFFLRPPPLPKVLPLQTDIL